MRSISQITTDVPAELGSGKVNQLMTRQGVTLSEWNFKCKLDISGQKNAVNDMQIVFCIKEGVSWDMGKHGRYGIEAGESCICKSSGEPEEVCWQKDREYHFKSVKLPVVYMQKLLDEYLSASQQRIFTENYLNSANKITVTPYLKRILAELGGVRAYQGDLGYMFMESKMLELLAEYFRVSLDLYIPEPKNSSISKTDQASILEAKAIIDAQIAYAPGYRELARQVHISTSKLAGGFLKMFGMPVHTYIIEKRLETAALLLEEGMHNVSQTAAVVGYSNVSHFSAAFKKKYGILPKEYARNSRFNNFG